MDEWMKIYEMDVNQLSGASMLKKIEIAQQIAYQNLFILKALIKANKEVLSRLEALENPQTERNDDGQETGTTMR